jgi:hypothetical protein
MGLDMYLYARKYVSGYGFGDRGDQDKQLYEHLVEELDAKEIVDPDTPSCSVEFCAAYWRKENAIHSWFVQNCQNGVDDCGDHYVSRAQIQDLVRTCREVLASTHLIPGELHAGTTFSTSGAVEHYAPGLVLADPHLAEQLLPTQSGFFFGDTEYTQYYWEGLKDTIRQSERCLAADPDWDFYYHSSW